jgi:hypothetical protein
MEVPLNNLQNANPLGPLRSWVGRVGHGVSCPWGELSMGELPTERNVYRLILYMGGVIHRRANYCAKS